MQAVGKKMGDFNADTGISKFSCCCFFASKTLSLQGVPAKAQALWKNFPLASPRRGGMAGRSSGKPRHMCTPTSAVRRSRFRGQRKDHLKDILTLSWVPTSAL